MVAAQLARRDHPRIEISHETELLDTGGGVARALPLLDEAFFVVNGDVLWLDGKDRALQRLAAAFDPDRMDAILLLQRTMTAVGYEGSGDYFIDAFGTPAPPQRARGRPLPFRRHPAAAPPVVRRHLRPRFSLVRLFDRAERAGRLHAIVHDGEWYHVGTPAGPGRTRHWRRTLARPSLALRRSDCGLTGPTMPQSSWPKQAKVYTIAPDRPFLATLAAGLLKMARAIRC